MKHYLWIIKTRWKNSPVLFFSWIGLRTKKALKINFYENTSSHKEELDAVIPTVSKDFELLGEVVASVRAHVLNPVQNIYIISRPEKQIIEFCAQHDCHFVDELSVLGYGKNAVYYNVNGVDRSGWMFQQLLKLSAGAFTKCDSYFILDSDTILIRDHIFIEDKKFVFLQSEEWHTPYFKAFKKMFGYPAKTKLSYTSHMMIFNKEKLREMKAELEEKHSISWDKAYLSTIDENEASCVSDYDTYANWILVHYPELMINKPLYNKPLTRAEFGSLSSLEKRYAAKQKSLSFHSYIKQ